jgi:hypothetical protein
MKQLKRVYILIKEGNLPFNENAMALANPNTKLAGLNPKKRQL